jgi:hypothetical protein
MINRLERQPQKLLVDDGCYRLRDVEVGDFRVASSYHRMSLLIAATREWRIGHPGWACKWLRTEDGGELWRIR